VLKTVGVILVSFVIVALGFGKGNALKKKTDFLYEMSEFVRFASEQIRFSRSTTETIIYTTEQYIEDTENKLVEVISKIIGNEDIRVMITLDTSVENIYADATKINTNTTENQASGNNTKTERKDSEEKEYIIVKDSDGNEQALIETTVMPQIRGVLVVCPGSNDDAISETVRNAVVTVLNINAKKVCVVSSLN